MSTGVIIAVVAVVVIVAALIAAVAMKGGSGGVGLKRRFGPEYERTLALHDGDTRATRRELTERVKRYGGIEQRALPEQEQERYAAQWTAIQAKFVEDPPAAITQADELIARLAAELGYPAADSPEHVDALSVHHPHHVHGYREAHAAAAGGRHGTEELRKTLVAARALFEGLLRGNGRTRDSEPDAAAEAEPETAREGAPETTPDTTPEAAPNESKPVIGKRLAALNGRGRTESER
ncbi:hypothetical protein OG900_28900 [Streptomyces sp. NBC_00433]